MDYFRVMRSVAAESIISGGLRSISEKKLVCCDPVHSRRTELLTVVKGVEEGGLLPVHRSEDVTLQVENLMCR